jgi:membrane fusion protein (multidrug efflux system)
MRYLAAILALVLLVGGLAAIKAKQITNLIGFGKAMKEAGPPPEAVGTAVAQEQTWGGSLAAVGTIASAKGVAISTEVPGVVSAIRFESGATVKEGQVLIELDSRIGRTRALVNDNAIAPSQLDADESAVKTSTADLGALRAQIDRKVVRAPFSGRLGIRLVNVGQYLNPGTALTDLQAIDSVFADFSLPQQRLEAVTVGMPVRVAIDGAAGVAADGIIVAIDPTVDAATRTLKLRASVPNKEEKLRPGMFATVSVLLPDRGTIVAIPASAVVHASYGDSVFVVEDKKDDGARPVEPNATHPKVVRQQFVRVGEARGDFVSIVDGIKTGQEVVSSGAFKLRNGASIAINNEVAVTPELAPHPQNR